MSVKSIADLNREANAYPFNPVISFSKWVYACQTLLRESRVYESEDSIDSQERVYVLNMRFADLVVNKLRDHPEFSKHKLQYDKLFAQLPGAINKSEQIKKKSNKPPRNTIASGTSEPLGTPTDARTHHEHNPHTTHPHPN